MDLHPLTLWEALSGLEPLEGLTALSAAASLVTSAVLILRGRRRPRPKDGERNPSAWGEVRGEVRGEVPESGHRIPMPKAEPPRGRKPDPTLTPIPPKKKKRCIQDGCNREAWTHSGNCVAHAFECGVKVGGFVGDEPEAVVPLPKGGKISIAMETHREEVARIVAEGRDARHRIAAKVEKHRERRGRWRILVDPATRGDEVSETLVVPPDERGVEVHTHGPDDLIKLVDDVASLAFMRNIPASDIEVCPMGMGSAVIDALNQRLGARVTAKVNPTSGVRERHAERNAEGRAKRGQGIVGACMRAGCRADPTIYVMGHPYCQEHAREKAARHGLSPASWGYEPPTTEITGSLTR